MPNKIAIYSPGVCGSVGHALDYAKNICYYLNKKKIDYVLFTLSESNCLSKLKESNINFEVSSQYKSGSINKKRFLKYGILSSLIYGIYRISYHYSLIREFYEKNDIADTFLLFEFEYIAALLFFLKNKVKLKKTILFFHSSDFCWVKNRSLSINLYKSLLKFFLPYLVNNSIGSTVHGDFLKDELVKNLNIKNKGKISSIPYGCNKYTGNISKGSARKSLNLKEKNIYGLFFGVLREDKGILELIDSLPKIDRKIYLIIAGSEGDIKKELIIEKIKLLNLEKRIILNIKYLSDEEVALYYLASDFIFITHKSYHVAFSGPLSLAVEYQRPVIATNSGELGQFVKKYNIGNSYESDNWKSLIEVTNAFCHTNNRTYNFKLALEENSWENMTNKILSIGTST
jgi:glycosyltransferase involved in cell wall biosynthesis